MVRNFEIVLADRELRLLNQLVNKRKIEKQLEVRIKILLMSFSKFSYKHICSELECSEPTISKWKQRWIDNYEKLQVFSKGIDGAGVSDTELINEILTILGDAPRSGAPLTFIEEIQKKIQAIACESPSKYGLPFTHWTHEELAKRVILEKIVETISDTQIGRILKKTA